MGLVFLKCVKISAIQTAKAIQFVKDLTRIRSSAMPGVNFINILPTALALVDPESVKSTVKS